MPLPTQDQVMGQLRILIPAIGTIVSAVGIASPGQVSSTEAALMTAVGPIAYIIVALWSLAANSRASIMKSAAQPVVPGAPAPVIVLPVQEAALAQTLPDNVTTTAETKVVPK